MQDAEDEVDEATHPVLKIVEVAVSRRKQLTARWAGREKREGDVEDQCGASWLDESP